MKFLFDLLPLIFFFGTFKLADANAAAAAAFANEHLAFLVSGGSVDATEAPVLLATLVVIVATVVQIVLTYIIKRKVDTMLWITFVLVGGLGGLTVWFHDPTFIKWKPSALYWTMALALWVSQTFFHKNMLRAVVGDQIAMPERIWSRVNTAWALFFAAIGVLNLYVAFNYSTSTWATFKVFGITGIMFVFMVVQGLLVARHVEPVDEPDGVPVAGDVNAKR